MIQESLRLPSLGLVAYMAFTFLIAGYCGWASVKGDYGFLRRVEVDARVETLSDELAALNAEVASRSNLTRRLSEDYLDLDLLDEQAREVLGYVRMNDVVLH